MKVYTTLTVLFAYYASYAINSSSESDSESESSSNSSDNDGKFKLQKTLNRYTEEEFDEKFKNIRLGARPKIRPRLPPSFDPPKPPTQPKMRGNIPEDDPTTSGGAYGYTPQQPQHPGQPQPHPQPQGAYGYSDPSNTGATGYTQYQPQGPYGYTPGHAYRFPKVPRTSTPKGPGHLPPPPPFTGRQPYVQQPQHPGQPQPHPQPQGAYGYTPQQPQHPGQQPQPHPQPQGAYGYTPGYGPGPYYTQGPYGYSPAVIPPPGLAPIGTPGSGSGSDRNQGPSQPGLYEEVIQGNPNRPPYKDPYKQPYTPPSVPLVQDIELNTKNKVGAPNSTFEESYGPNGRICHIFSPMKGFMFKIVKHKDDVVWFGNDTERAVQVTLCNIGFPEKKMIILLNNGMLIKFKKTRKGWVEKERTRT